MSCRVTEGERITGAEHPLDGARTKASGRPRGNALRAGEDPERQAERIASRIVDGSLAPSPLKHDFQQLPGLIPALGAQTSGGQPMAADIGGEVGQALGFDFSTVRVHSDTIGARLAERMRAKAVALGTRIAFAPGRYQPRTEDGRRLIAHELVHIAQQQKTGPVAQLAPMGSPLSPGVLTLDWDVRFKLNRPRPDEINAAPGEVLTSEGITDLNALRIFLGNDLLLQAQVEGNASIEGDPGQNLQLSARRARWVANQIGPLRIAAAPGHLPDCPQNPRQFRHGFQHQGARRPAVARPAEARPAEEHLKGPPPRPRRQQAEASGRFRVGSVTRTTSTRRRRARTTPSTSG